MLERGAVALDVRADDEFIAGHVPGSISIPLAGQFASWAGAVLGLSSKPVLIAATPEQLSEARLRLARIGIEDVAGYLQDGVEGWRQAGLTVANVPQITPQELASRLAKGDISVLDVRREAEFQAGHIEGADWHPLDRFKAALPEIPRYATVAVHCKSGYRSLIACSLLRRAGYNRMLIFLVDSTRGWRRSCRVRFPKRWGRSRRSQRSGDTLRPSSGGRRCRKSLHSCGSTIKPKRR